MKLFSSGKRRAAQAVPRAPVRHEPPPTAGFAASPLSAPMHGGFYLDDELLEGRRLGLETVRERTLRAREAFKGVRQRDGAQVLAALGGSEPDLQMPKGSGLGSRIGSAR